MWMDFLKISLAGVQSKVPFVCKQAVATFHLNCKQVLYQLQVLFVDDEVNAKLKPICMDV